MEENYFNEEVDAAVKADEEKKNDIPKKTESEESANSANVKITKRQMDSTLSALNKSKSDIIEITNKLQVHIENLADEGVILNEIPDKLAIQLKEAIPEISKEIRVQCLSDLDVSMKKCYDNVILLEDATAAMLEQSKTFESVKMKKTIIQMAITIIIAVSCSASLTYFMMRKFPHFVSLDTRGNVRIDNSQIYLTEKKDPTVSATTEKLKPGKVNR